MLPTPKNINFMNLKNILLLTLAFVIGFCSNILAHDVELKKGFVQSLVSDQLVEPTSIVVAKDGRIFVTERAGKVRIIENGTLLDVPFLEVNADLAGERGLGSIALHPEFESNGFVYVYYTVADSNFNRLSKFVANGNTVVPNSETVLMQFDKLAGVFHNGGAIRFAPDGKLILSIGDGLWQDKAQLLDNFFGKVLRLNDDGTIPEDNPFYNELGGDLRAIYALGLRNSFTFDLNPITGQILANDVGLVSHEEVNEILPGKNYGWPLIEGYRTGQTPPDNYQEPFYVYPHDNGKCAVVGGAFYQPETGDFPQEYFGKYIFSDYCTGLFQVLDPQGGVVDTILKGADFVSNLYTSFDGYLYYVSFSAGELWKVAYVGEGQPFISNQPKDVLAVVGESAEFNIENFGDEPLSYQWYRNGSVVVGANAASISLANVSLSDSADVFYCMLSNLLDTVYSDSAYLWVTANQRPEPVIYLPVANAKYDNGDTIWFAGNVFDNEEGELSVNNLEWKIDFHHDEHAHPAMPRTSGIKDGYFVIPTLGETDTNVWYRVTLSATDSKGVDKTIYHEVFPNKVNTTLETTPKGLKLLLDGAEFLTPHTFKSTTKNERVTSAPPLQVRNDSLFRFIEWENGDTSAFQPLLAGQKTYFNATYQFVRPFYEGEGDGLNAFYFDDIYFTPPASDSGMVPEVDYYWDFASHSPWTFPSDSFSVRFTGSILAPISGEYVFTLIFDDQVDLKLNGNTIVYSNDRTDEPGVSSSPIVLEGGKRYNLELDYVEWRWISKIKLYWSFADQPRQIIPQSFLYREEAPLGGDTIIIGQPTGELKLYPNPSNDLVKVSWASASSVEKEVFVYTVSGRQVATAIWSEKSLVYQLNIGQLEAGVYIVKVLAGDDTQVQRFVKQ